MKSRSLKLLATFILAAAATACNGGGDGVVSGNAFGADTINGNQKKDVGSNDSSPQVGASCHSSDPDKICLSLRYVAYAQDGKVVDSPAQAASNVNAINAVWNKCGIAFEIGEYLAPNPSDYGLEYNTSSTGDLDTIRSKFESNDKLLVVMTGEWSGSLGSGAADAWAAMPGGDPLGVIIQASVSDYPNILAHELGHYLSLDHYGDSSNLMSPVVGDSSQSISSDQCTQARDAATHYFAAALR